MRWPYSLWVVSEARKVDLGCIRKHPEQIVHVDRTVISIPPWFLHPFLLEFLTDFSQWLTVISMYKSDNPFHTWASQCARNCFIATRRNKICTSSEKLSVRQKIIDSFASVYLSAQILAKVNMAGFLLPILAQNKKCSNK